jgi:hypothetical protein
MSILERRIKENELKIHELKQENEALTWQFVHEKATQKHVIHAEIEKIKQYVEKHYGSDSAFVELLHKNITMAPMTDSLFRMTKYNTRVSYNTVLYEWNGQRIMYIRADPNSDHYYSECDSFNGFDVGEIDTHSWWKTDTEAIPDYNVVLAIEKAITSRKFDCSNVPDMYKILVAIFDLNTRSPYLITDDILAKSYEFLPE